MKNQILWDCHMHSSFSTDSETPMEDMIQAAISRNLSGICFTEHFDPDYPADPDGLTFDLDIPAYHARLHHLKEKYSQDLQIHFGIEIGLQPHLARQFRQLLEDYPFDFVIGSSHVVHGQDPYYPEFYQGRKVTRCYMEYFESILENLSVFDQMDVYGHLDYIVRYGPGQNASYSYGRFQDILDEILKQLIRRHVGLELNTGGYHYGLGEPNPCSQVIRRYRELGGEIVTIGADAHDPSKVAYGFEKAADLLADCGFTYYTVFCGRKPQFLKL